jgi:uncharacterized protein
MTLIFIAAITLGFLGSFHCVGMCGPIALALPVGNARGISRLLLILSYNAGRMLTYSAFGILAGLAGRSIAIAGYQQLLSVMAGILLLLFILIPAGLKPFQKMNSGIFIFFNRIKSSLSALFLRKGHRSLFTIGLLNGLLPCGLVYMALAGAIATGAAMEGAFFMAAFGLGTLPMMLALPFAGSFISLKTRNTMRRAVPALLACMAVLLILRGLNLGIPYISPKTGNDNNIPSCHSSANLHSKNNLPCSGQSYQHKK